MINLIRKDMKLLINYFVTAIPVSICFVMIFAREYPGYGYAMSAFAIASLFIISVPSLEAKNDTDIIINSLPVLRSEIILTKYLLTFLYTAIGLLMVALAGLLVKISPLPFDIVLISWPNIVIAFISTSILVSIYFPLFYRYYSGTVALVINVVLFQFLFFMPNYVSTYILENRSEVLVHQLLHFNQNTPWGLPLIGLITALLLQFISYHFTQRFYSARDF